MNSRNHSDLLGKKATDVVTQLSGTIIGVSHWLNGCCRVLVEPVKEKDAPASEWVDIEQIEVSDEPTKARTLFENHTPTGGPRKDASRRSIPR